MINIKELVAKLKQEGVSDEEIKKQLEALKSEIDAVLSPVKPEGEGNPEPKEEEETDEQKNARLFGNL